MTGRKKFFEPKQKIIVPRGTIPQNDVAIIEMPKTLRRNSVCIVEKKEGKEGEPSNRYYGRPSSYDYLDANAFQNGVNPVSAEYPTNLRPGTAAAYPNSILPVPPNPLSASAFPPLQTSGYPLAPQQMPMPTAMPTYQQSNVCPAMQQQAAPLCPGMSQPQCCALPRPMMCSMPMMQMPFPQMGFSQPFQCRPLQQQQPQSQPGAYIMFFYNPAMQGFGRSNRCPGQMQQPQCTQQAGSTCPPIQQPQCGQAAPTYPSIQQAQCSQPIPSCQFIQQTPSAHKKNVSLNLDDSKQSSSRYQLPPGKFGFDCSMETNRSKTPYNFDFNLSDPFSSTKMSEKEMIEKEQREQKQLEIDLKNFQKARRYFVGQASVLADSSASISSGKLRSRSRKYSRDEDEFEDEDENVEEEDNMTTDEEDEEEEELNRSKKNKSKRERENSSYNSSRRNKSDYAYDGNTSTKSNKKMKIKNLANSTMKSKYTDENGTNDDINESKEAKNKYK